MSRGEGGEGGMSNTDDLMKTWGDDYGEGETRGTSAFDLISVGRPQYTLRRVIGEKGKESIRKWVKE